MTSAPEPSIDVPVESAATSRSPRRRRAISAVVVLALIAAAGWFVFGSTDRRQTFYANFVTVGGINVGSAVTVLGVDVGTVTSVQPQGTSVRVGLSMPDGIDIPADVSAYILNPSLVSDRHVELSPAYTGGATLGDGEEIPVERTAAPIDFDTLLGSINTLTDTLGNDGGNLGAVLARGADTWAGHGEDFNTAMRALAGATGVIGAHTADLDQLVTALTRLYAALDARQTSLDGLVQDLAVLGDSWAGQDLDVTEPLADLRTLFDQINAFMAANGDQLGAIAGNVETLSATAADHQAGLAEFMDLVPLLMQNLGDSVGPDHRGRIRLNVTTTLTQFAVAAPLCAEHPLPLCTGAGFTNPIAFPISASDPLGIVSALTGGAPTTGGTP